MSALPVDPGTVRRATTGLAVAGAVGFVGLYLLGYPFAAVGVFLLGMAGTGVLRARAAGPVFDERDAALSREAARVTIVVFGLASAVVFPALTVAWGLDAFEWGPATTGVALTVAAVYLVYGVALLALRYGG